MMLKIATAAYFEEMRVTADDISLVVFTPRHDNDARTLLMTVITDIQYKVRNYCDSRWLNSCV